MDLGSFAIIAEELVVHVVYDGHMTSLFSRSTLKTLISIIDEFAFRVWSVAEEVVKCNPWRLRLLVTRRL